MLAQAELVRGPDILGAKQLMKLLPFTLHGHKLHHGLGRGGWQQQEVRVPVGLRHPKPLGKSQHQSSSSNACSGCLSFSPSIRLT